MTDKIGRLTQNVRVCGRFHLTGCHSDDLFADIVVLDGELLGLMMPTSDRIDRLLHNIACLDPVDKERVDEQIKRCEREGYVGLLGKLMANTFGADLDDWKQGYAYQFDQKNNKHQRVLLLIPPDDHEWLLRHMVHNLEEYTKQGGFDHFDAAPKHGPNAFRKRP